VTRSPAAADEKTIADILAARTPAAAARQNPRPCTRGHEPILSAGDAPKASEAVRQTSAPQRVAKLLLDQPWKSLAVPQPRGLRTQGLEVFTHDHLQDGRCGSRGSYALEGLRHAQPTGAPRANARNRSIRRGSGDRVSEAGPRSRFLPPADFHAPRSTDSSNSFSGHQASSSDS
jgi:hypothetical protein